MQKNNDGIGLLVLLGLFALSRRAFLRAESLENFRETAFTICKDRNGQLIRGSEAVGDSASHVAITPVCPSGCTTIGLWHSHPPGIPEASAADIFETRRLGIKHLCISSGDILRCQEIW